MNTNYRNGKCFKNMVTTDEGYFYLKYDMNFHADRILHKALHCTCAGKVHTNMRCNKSKAIQNIIKQ